MESLAAPERLGRYQLLEPLGAGPNGAVSRAKVFGVAGFERQFAVKRIASELTASPASAQALSAAARSYGSLEHPRIARMSEFGVAQGHTFTAVELVTGLDAMRLVADAKLGGNGLPAGGALALVSQIARAVGYAHGRGLTHLGLAPTNVIVTPDGDVKVTDFGILAATLPPRPAEVARLANRVGYLAPEQIAGEAPSAATDVFALGVIAYELVAGVRAYAGGSPADVAQAVLAGPPPDPQLPRPIVRVLQRCLARSPFERFPDARALADALDAALRVAPVPGTRKDIGAQVKATLDRIAAMNEGNLSGMLALNIGTAPSSEPGEVPTTEFVRPDVPVAGPPPLVGPRASPSIPKVPSTAPGIAPPPPPHMTMMGVAAAKKPAVPSNIPAIPKAGARNPRGSDPMPSITMPSVPRRPTDPPPTRSSPAPGDASRARAPSEIARAENLSRALSDLSTDIEPTREDAAASLKLARAHSEIETRVDPHRVAQQLSDLDSGGINASDERDLPTSEMPPLVVHELKIEARADTSEFEMVVSGGDFENPTTIDRGPSELAGPTSARVQTAPPVQESGSTPSPSSTMPGFAPPPSRGQSGPVIAPPAFNPHLASRKSGGGAIKALLLAAVLGGVAAGGYIAYTKYVAGGTATVATKGSTASAMKDVVATKGSADVGTTRAPDVGATKTSDVGATKGSAAIAAKGSADTKPSTGSATTIAGATADKSAPTPDKPAPTGASDQLQIASAPGGARVFIDGADQGTTPVKLPGSSDRHNIALLLPGHDLYVAEVDGHGKFAIDMKPVTPSGGPAGIKVLKCKKDRYYVYVDGKPTGMLCPTERIHTSIGQHTVEVYDAVSETRQKFDVNVPDDRLSARVRIE